MVPICYTWWSNGFCMKVICQHAQMLGCLLCYDVSISYMYRMFTLYLLMLSYKEERCLTPWLKTPKFLSIMLVLERMVWWWCIILRSWCKYFLYMKFEFNYIVNNITCIMLFYVLVLPWFYLFCNTQNIRP